MKTLELQITQTRHPKSVADRWTYLQDPRSEVTNEQLPFQIYAVNQRGLTPQAFKHHNVMLS